MPQIFVKFQRGEGILMRVLPGRFFTRGGISFILLLLTLVFLYPFGWKEWIDEKYLSLYSTLERYNL